MSQESNSRNHWQPGKDMDVRIWERGAHSTISSSLRFPSSPISQTLFSVFQILWDLIYHCSSTVALDRIGESIQLFGYKVDSSVLLTQTWNKRSVNTIAQTSSNEGLHHTIQHWNWKIFPCWLAAYGVVLCVKDIPPMKTIFTEESPSPFSY